MNKILLNGTILLIDDAIANFTVHQKPSTNVDYFGLDLAGRRMFVQFKNGGSYIYDNVDDYTMEESMKAESIGRYISSAVVGKFVSEKMDRRLVLIEVEEIPSDEPLSEPEF